MSQLILLVGPIASGKSTFVQEAFPYALVVNDDAIVTAIHGGNYTLYDKQLKSLYKQIELDIIHYGLSHNKTVIIDRPNLKRETRDRYRAIAKSLDCITYTYLFPDLGIETHVQRRMNNSRGYSKEYWEKVYLEHSKIYEVPTKEEGFLIKL